MSINGVETIQGGPKRVSAWSRNSPDYNGLAFRMKPACVKARVARKSRGQQCPYGFDSRPEHEGQFLKITSSYPEAIRLKLVMRNLRKDIIGDMTSQYYLNLKGPNRCISTT